MGCAPHCREQGSIFHGDTERRFAELYHVTYYCSGPEPQNKQDLVKTHRRLLFSLCTMDFTSGAETFEQKDFVMSSMHCSGAPKGERTASNAQVTLGHRAMKSCSGTVKKRLQGSGVDTDLRAAGAHDAQRLPPFRLIYLFKRSCLLEERRQPPSHQPSLTPTVLTLHDTPGVLSGSHGFVSHFDLLHAPDHSKRQMGLQGEKENVSGGHKRNGSHSRRPANMSLDTNVLQTYNTTQRDDWK